MTNNIIHLCPQSTGGVTDYVDVCLNNNIKKKIIFEKKSAYQMQLSGKYLLHFSGYGYAKRGAPLWLPNKIQTQRHKIHTLGIFFHELYAFGHPWSSAFWLSPVQRHIARRLVEMSDFWITNREGSAQWLRRFAGDKPYAVLPVFSNIGEMVVYTPERMPKIVVFGSAALRKISYRAAGEELFTWAQEQGLELHDIGPPIDDPVIKALMQSAGVIQHGRLEASEVSRQLSSSMFGVIAYPVDYVAKSGVFAAYCAHGVCPLLISKRYDSVDGLVARNNYFPGVPLTAIKDREVQNIGLAAWEWYQPHRVVAHVTTIKRLIAEASI